MIGIGPRTPSPGRAFPSFMLGRRALALALLLAAAPTWLACVSPGVAAPTAAPPELKVLVPSPEELAGYAVDPARTTSRGGPDDAGYDVTYVREPGAAGNGPEEIRFAIARTGSGQESARALVASVEALVATGWTTRAVAPLGNEAVGLESSDGIKAQHLYMFRYGRHVLGASVAGAPGTATSDQALGYAVRISQRLDLALAREPLEDPAPAPLAALGPAPAPAAQASVPSATTGARRDETTSASAAQSAGTQASSARASTTPPSAPVSAPTVVADVSLNDSPDVGAGFRLGGFSGLFALDAAGTTFATLSDRGPNGEIKVGGKKEMAFPLPTYTPRIIKLRLDGNALQIADTVPLRLADGHRDPVTKTRDVTGLPTMDGAGEAPYSTNGRDRLPFDPNGVDTEGIVLDPRDGSYWLAEEYGPSILHVAADGTVLARLVPSGLGLDAPGENVREILPSILTRRKANRGFEGVAISPDGGRVFAILQSPLQNPDKKAGEGSRHIRIVAIDTADANNPQLAGMYVYQAEAFGDVGAGEQDDVKIGDLAAVSATRVLVGERDSEEGGSHKRVYVVDLSTATDVSGRDQYGGKTLEQSTAADLRKAGVEYASKTMVVDLARLGFRPDKFEGLAIVNSTTLAVINDNDFGVESIDSRGRVTRSQSAGRLVVIRLPEALW